MCGRDSHLIEIDAAPHSGVGRSGDARDLDFAGTSINARQWCNREVSGQEKTPEQGEPGPSRT